MAKNLKDVKLRGVPRHNYCCDSFRNAVEFDQIDWIQDDQGRIERYLCWSFKLENVVTMHFCSWCYQRMPMKTPNPSGATKEKR